MVKCPKCGSAVAAAKFCGDCGEKLPKQDAAPPKDKPVHDKAKQVAHTANDDSAREPANAAGKKAVKIPNSVVYVVIALASIALICLIAFYPQGGDTGKQPDAAYSGVCGDGACNNGEDCGTCAGDCACQSGYECTNNKCVEADACGDGACDSGETCRSCPSDCGVCKSAVGEGCARSSDCSGGYCFNGTCRSSPPGCGDGHCDANETRLTCTADCGEPIGEGLNCLRNGDCISGYCVNKVCRDSSSYKQNATPSGYSVSWSPLSGEGFWMLFPTAPEGESSTGIPYAPGGLYGLTITCVDGACRRYDYWRDYAAKHCLENVGGMSPQDIRAAARDPTQNCERFNASEAVGTAW